MNQTPRIVYSPLSNRWFLLTRYKKVTTGIDAKTGAPKAYLRAQIEYDITDQMVTIIREVERRTLARKRMQAADQRTTP